MRRGGASDMHRRGRRLGITPARPSDHEREQEEEVRVGETADSHRAVLPERAYALVVFALAVAAALTSTNANPGLGSTPIFLGLFCLQAINCWASGWLQQR